jgi:hypothetical protein
MIAVSTVRASILQRIRLTGAFLVLSNCDRFWLEYVTSEIYEKKKMGKLPITRGDAPLSVLTSTSAAIRSSFVASRKHVWTMELSDVSGWAVVNR